MRIDPPPVYELDFSAAARRDLRRLAGRVPLDGYLALEATIEGLAAEPRPRGTVKLAAEEGVYRVRVRRYRLIYSVDDRARVVTILRVLPRAIAYR